MGLRKFIQHGLPLNFIPAFRPALSSSETDGDVTVTPKNAVLKATAEGGRVTLTVEGAEFLVSHTGDGTVRVTVI